MLCEQCHQNFVSSSQCYIFSVLSSSLLESIKFSMKVYPFSSYHQSPSMSSLFLLLLLHGLILGCLLCSLITLFTIFRDCQHHSWRIQQPDHLKVNERGSLVAFRYSSVHLKTMSHEAIFLATCNAMALHCKLQGRLPCVTPHVCN